MKSTTTIVLAHPGGADLRLAASQTTQTVKAKATEAAKSPKCVANLKGRPLKLIRPSLASRTSWGRRYFDSPPARAARS